MKVKALLSAVEANREVGEALVELGHPSVQTLTIKLTRKHLAVLCNALDIELTAERRAAMQAMDNEALERLLEAIAAQRRWPAEVK